VVPTAKVISPIPLSSNPDVYVPSKLVARTQQLELFNKLISDIRRGCYPPTVFVSGPKSMGKTVTVLHFIKSLESSDGDLDTVYIRCRYTFRESLKAVLGNVPRSVCSAIDTLFSKYNSPTLLFLDEFHNLKLKRQEINVPLRHLYDSYKGEVIPVIISNIPFREMKKLFDDDLLSRMSWDLSAFINFPPYNLTEIYRILLQRCQEALAPNCWEDKAILKCAKYGAQTKNLRNAIDLLREACTRFPDDEVLREKHVEACLSTAGMRALAEDLNNEPLHIRLYLTAIALEQLNTLRVTTVDVEQRYHKLCDLISETPIKFTYRLRKRLEEMGLITIDTKRYAVADSLGKKTRGSTTFLSLEEDPRKLLKTLAICEWDDIMEGATLKEKLNRIVEKWEG